MTEQGRLANQAWEAMLTAHTRLMREFEAADVWTDLSMREYDVLYTLSKCATAVRMGELGRSVLLSQPGLSRLVDRLVHRGLVDRSPDPGDGRSVLVSLTPAGLERQKRVGRQHARSVAQAMSAVDPADLAQLYAIATRLSHHDTAPEEAHR